MKTPPQNYSVISIISIGAYFCISLLLFSITNIGQSAEVIKTTLPNKVHVTAFYQQGEKNRSAILVIHGFLQTRNYLTVSGLSNSLTEDGYTVLAPTLSLGINHRQRSLPCDAIHTHTMQDDISEITFWVNWLAKKGHNKIMLVGHSYGSLQSLAYASQQPNPAVKKIIATSLVDVEHVIGKENVYHQIHLAREQIKKDKNSLNKYQLSYCKKFVSPAYVFLSYAKWTKTYLLKSLNEIKLPVEIILGSNDNRMGENWPKLVATNGASVTIIQGANHFFDAEHEFDLLENVQQSIENSTNSE